ncbi:MAG: response regulator [Cyanobacteria bacterium P01_A01_bin.83]
MIHNASLANFNDINSVLARDKLNKNWRSHHTANNSPVKSSKNFESLAKIAPLLNLSLADTVSVLTEIIDFETNILDKNYQSEYLSPHREGKKLKILVIEDRDDNRNYISSMLRTENFQVMEAKDSKTAIKLAHAEVPDLIICELMMPIIDGYGVIDSLCHSTITGNMLLLFITAHHQKTEIGSEILLVSDKGEIKPLTKAKLLKAINRHANAMTVFS